jgi:hypothetical protein
VPSVPLNVPGHSESGTNQATYPAGTFIANKIGDYAYGFKGTSLGTLTNDLYSPANPALEMMRFEGRIDASPGLPVRVLITEDDTLLVPGPSRPGDPAISYAASQAWFEAATHSIRFRNPFGTTDGCPIVAVDGSDGTFYSVFNGASDPLIGASLVISPFAITHQDANGVDFADAPFSLDSGSTILAQGTFVGIHLDLVSGDFLANTADVTWAADDPLVAELFGNPYQYQFMSPMAAMYLYELADNFSATEDVDLPELTLVNHNASTPEPATLTLLGLGAAGLFGYVHRQRKK